MRPKYRRSTAPSVWPWPSSLAAGAGRHGRKGAVRDRVECAQQNIDGVFGEARPDDAFIGRDIAARRGRRGGAAAERATAGEREQRRLLQALGVKLDGLDLVAEHFLGRGIDDGARA